MTAPIIEADREAARGLLTVDKLNFYEFDKRDMESARWLRSDVETAAQVIAGARQTERDKWIAAAERHAYSDSISELLVEMGLL